MVGYYKSVSVSYITRMCMAWTKMYHDSIAMMLLWKMGLQGLKQTKYANGRKSRRRDLSLKAFHFELLHFNHV